MRRDAERSLETTKIASAELHHLREHARSVTELLELIHEIADRSDLLALNGSLEAVRAGEAGRGFSIVAVEMRRLAERVGGVVESIRRRVASIEASAGTAVDSTERSRTLAESTTKAAHAINDVVIEQGRKTQDAVVAVGQVADAVSTFEGSVDQTRSTAEGLREHARRLELLTSEFRT